MATGLSRFPVPAAMRRPRRFTSLTLGFALLCGLSALPLRASARGGGGGHWDGGGGGGRAYRFSAPRAEAAPAPQPAPVEHAAPVERQAPAAPREEPAAGRITADPPADRALHLGYSGSHPLYGPASRTAWSGHNISAAQFQRFNRPGWNGGWNNRWNGGWNNGPGSPGFNFYNRNVGGWNNDWANGGYWGSRPWGYGWYSWNPGSWGWWGSASPGWGLAALAGADVITSLVDDAASQQQTVIEVPGSDYQLNYATVDSVGSSGADFSYAVAGSPPVKGAANCQAGLLDGQVPSTAAQAQLLNAACQVAYGPDPKGKPLPERPGADLPSWLRDLLVLALGSGLATAGWQLWSRRGGGGGGGNGVGGGHHAPVTSA
ncbi:MAG: hypothetical protein VKK98_04410 [Cyanobacteriota bacterium]|nr:hypothetical protein [Cyanobacteriota bacterium]